MLFDWFRRSFDFHNLKKNTRTPKRGFRFRRKKPRRKSAKRNKFIIYKKNYFNNYHYFKRRKPKKSYRIIRRGRFRFKLPIFPRKPRTYRIARRRRRKKRKNYRRVWYMKKRKKNIKYFKSTKGFPIVLLSGLGVLFFVSWIIGLFAPNPNNQDDE